MMNLSVVTNLALWLGVIIEILWLFDQHTDGDRFSPPRVSLSPLRTVISLLLLGGLLLLGVLEFFDFAEMEVESVPLLSDLNSILVGILFALIPMLGLLPRVLPRVSEQTILSVHVTVLLGLYLQRGSLPAPALIAALLVPSALLLYAALNPSPLPLILNAASYLWYLITLLLLALQHGFLGLLKSSPTDAVEAFIFGSSYVFFFLHIFFLLRFTLMLLALVLPRHRPYLDITMSQLFSDVQLSRRQLMTITALALLILMLNHWLGLLPNLSLVGILVVWIVQGVPTLKLEKQDRRVG